MDKKQPSTKRKATTAKKRATMTWNHSSHPLTRNDLAALEQLDHLLELQRRREQQRRKLDFY